MLVEGFPAQVLATNCWVIAAGAGEQCIIVDPGGGLGDHLTDLLDRHRLRPAAVVSTHGHFDHTMSVAPLCARYAVPYYLHPADRAQLLDPWSAIGLPRNTPVPGFEDAVPAEPDEVRALTDGATLDLAGVRLTARGVPGHTPGSVSLELAGGGPEGQDVLFTGDFLFAGSIGRMDFPGGSEEQMGASLRARCCRARTRRSCTPDTGRPPPSAASARATRICGNCHERRLRRGHGHPAPFFRRRGRGARGAKRCGSVRS